MSNQVVIVPQNNTACGMDDDDYHMLIRLIQEEGYVSGKVLKANGRWYIDGKKEDVPRPIIKLPHWTEGTKKVVIEAQKEAS